MICFSFVIWRQFTSWKPVDLWDMNRILCDFCRSLHLWETYRWLSCHPRMYLLESTGKRKDRNTRKKNNNLWATELRRGVKFADFGFSISLPNNRCLEEGAEEFFLKPVKLSDLNRLRPHMVRTKLMHQEPQKDEKQEEESENKPETQQQQSNSGNSNKRKAVEEGIPPDRARPRYSGVTTAVWGPMINLWF